MFSERELPRSDAELHDHFERALAAAQRERAVPSGLQLTLEVIGLLRDIAAAGPNASGALIDRVRAAFEDQLSGAFAAAERDRIISRRRNS